MIVKSVRDVDHDSDLERAFQTLDQFGIKLNPETCVWGQS